MNNYKIIYPDKVIGLDAKDLEDVYHNHICPEIEKTAIEPLRIITPTDSIIEWNFYLFHIFFDDGVDGENDYEAWVNKFQLT